MIPSLAQQINAAASHHEPAAARGSAAELLDLIAREGPISTTNLAKKTGLASQQVWGMLKHHRNSGRVKFAGKAWSLSDAFKGRDVERSVRMLRAMGYAVRAPKGKHA